MKYLSILITLAVLSFQSNAAFISAQASVDEQSNVSIIYDVDIVTDGISSLELAFDFDLFGEIDEFSIVNPNASDVDIFQLFRFDFGGVQDPTVLVIESLLGAFPIGELLKGLEISIEYLGNEPLTQFSQSVTAFDDSGLFQPISLSSGLSTLTVNVESAEIDAPRTLLMCLLSCAFMYFKFRKNND
jgi:hypothetical protein